MKQSTIDFSLACWANLFRSIFWFAIHWKHQWLNGMKEWIAKRSWQGRHWCAFGRPRWSVALRSVGWRYRRDEVGLTRWKWRVDTKIIWMKGPVDSYPLKCPRPRLYHSYEPVEILDHTFSR
jgi:hypothetical protein